MVVCQFFLRGQCKFGASCKNEHPGGGPTAASKAPQPLLFTTDTIKQDLTSERPTYALSVYAPAKAEPNLITGTDLSPEELRVKFYEAKAANNESLYPEARLVGEVEQKVQGVLGNLSAAVEYAKNQSITSSNPSSAPPNPFGGSANTSAFGAPKASAFGSGGVLGTPTKPSAFGAPSGFGAFSTPGGASSGFGKGGAFSGGNTTSPFGSTAAKPNAFASPSATPAFGAPSAFGAPAAPAPAFGASTAPAPVFGASTSGSTAFGGAAAAPAFGAPAFGSSSGPAPAFGAPSTPAGPFGGTGFGASTSGAGGFGAFAKPAGAAPSAFASGGVQGTPPPAPSAFSAGGVQGPPSSTPSAFGAGGIQGPPAPAPAFGSSSTPAFGSTGFGGGGSQPQPTANPFGTPGGAASTIHPTSSSSPFGQARGFGSFASPATSTPAFGSTGFGTSATPSPFGAVPRAATVVKDPYAELEKENQREQSEAEKAAWAADKFSWGHIPAFAPPLGVR